MVGELGGEIEAHENFLILEPSNLHSAVSHRTNVGEVSEKSTQNIAWDVVRTSFPIRILEIVAGDSEGIKPSSVSVIEARNIFTPWFNQSIPKLVEIFPGNLIRFWVVK